VSKAEQEVINYARNRIALSAIKDKIKVLLNNKSIDLDVFRLDWLGKDYGWQGWLVAVDDYEEEATKDERDLAWLLDEKKKILREAGQIKRNIYMIGAGLVRNNKEGFDLVEG